jgi:hypothetical protein
MIDFDVKMLSAICQYTMAVCGFFRVTFSDEIRLQIYGIGLICFATFLHISGRDNS